MSEDKNYFEQSVEMWERMAGSYMDTMFKAMEKTMEQSATLRKKVDEAVHSAVRAQVDAMEKGLEQSAAFRKQVDEAVQSAVNTQIEATLSAIKAVERQIEALTSKVDELLQKK